MPTSKDKHCAVCGSTQNLQSHHVLGRVGQEQHAPWNLITLCLACHHKWHNVRPKAMQDVIYKRMKSRHGDRFPMQYHGRPYYTKWLLETEARLTDDPSKEVVDDVGDFTDQG